MNGRVLFYVQHLLGVGHLRRSAILAETMSAIGLKVTVAYGGVPFPDVQFKGVTVAPLPPATIAGEDFSTLRGADGRPVDEAWLGTRRTKLLELYHEVEPDVVLIELYPFGRRQFRFELTPLLELIHGSERRPRVACSVRDILVSRKPGRAEETVETLRRYFDLVLVHGDPSLIPFETTFPLAGRISDLIRYTGYAVATGDSASSAEGKDEVIVSAGGGAVGAPLLSAAMEARPMTQFSGRRWRFLTGPNLPDLDYQRLAEKSDSRTIVERFRPDFASLLRNAALSISQAGYNTTMDILASGVRAVVVPYEAKGETEQRLRAELLAERQLLALVPEGDLNPARLADAVAIASRLPPRAAAVDLSGATKTARFIAELALTTNTWR
jgi:predicted glycosyltransferase